MRRILPILAVLLIATAWAASGQPVPNMPSNGASDLPINVTIGWRPLTSVAGYEAQISLTPSFSEYEPAITSESSIEIMNLLYQTTYYWRVQGIDEAGDPLTDWSSVQSFTTTSGTGVPQPILPEDGATDQPRTIQLSWSGVPGASGYEMEYASDPSFQGGVQVSSTGTTHTLANLDYAQQIFWRVRLMTTAAPAEWSRYFSFTTEYAKPDPLDAPRLLSPANGATDQTTPLALEWSSVGSKDIHYDVEVGLDDAFGDLAYSSLDVDSTSLDLAALESDRIYFWRARSRNSETQSEWSSVFRFATRPDLPSGPLAPQLLTPINGAQLIPETILLTWDSIDNATWYEVEFGRDQLFLEVDSLIRIVEATAEMGGLAPETTYHWRARAGNENGPSGWSRPFRFTTAPEEAVLPEAPRLLFPTNNAADVELSTALIWLPAANATSYAVQLSATGDFNGEEQTVDAIDTIVMPDGLAEGTSYYWRAQGRNPFGASEWSGPFRFTTASGGGVLPDAPRLLFPADNAVDVELPTQLIWLPAANATSYAVQLSTTGDFNGEEQTFDAVDTTTVPDGLVEGTSYYWRAQGRNSVGASEWSEARSFTTAGSSSVGDERDNERMAAIRIYPIPASENLIVEIPGGDAGVAVGLFDARGVLRMEREFQSGEGESGRFALSLDGVPAGFWFCRIVLNDTVLMRPVIVIR